MRGFIGLTRRNLLIYFKDIYGVIFSMLTSIIVFVLYLLFLKGTFVDAINSAMTGLEDFVSAEQIEALVNGMLLVGIMGSALVTVPYTCLQTIVRDREQKVDYDISATPLKRGQIILAYFTAAVISTFVVTGMILTVGLLILQAGGEMYLAFSDVALAYSVILLGAFSATALFMLVVLLFKSASTASAFFGILSAASGFVIGAYIPISQFSDGVQTICNLFPASHITILFRNVLLGGILDSINASIGGVDNGLFTEAIRTTFTFRAQLFGTGFTISQMVLYVCSLVILCTAGMVVIYSKTYKRR